MRTVSAFLSALAVSAWLALPAGAFECPSLIGEGRSLVANAKLSAAQSKKIKALLAEAEKLHNAGSHGGAVEKANEALALLKKK